MVLVYARRPLLPLKRLRVAETFNNRVAPYRWNFFNETLYTLVVVPAIRELSKLDGRLRQRKDNESPSGNTARQEEETNFARAIADGREEFRACCEKKKIIDETRIPAKILDERRSSGRGSRSWGGRSRGDESAARETEKETSRRKDFGKGLRGGLQAGNLLRG